MAGLHYQANLTITRMNIQVLIYIVHPSRYAPARSGRFLAAGEYPGKHVYGGRALGLDEFHALPADFFQRVDSGGQPVRIQILTSGEEDTPQQKEEPKPAVDLKAVANKTMLVKLAAKHGLELDPAMSRREMEDALVAHLADTDDE